MREEHHQPAGSSAHSGDGPLEDLQRLNEERLRALSQHASDLVAIVDASGTFTYVSPSYSRILGYNPEDLLGKNAAVLLPREEQQRMTLRLPWLIEAAESNAVVEYRTLHADGSERIFEVHVNNQLHNKAIRGIITTGRDITENRYLQRRTHDALEALLTMVDVLVHVEDGEVDTEEYVRTGTKAAAQRVVELVRQVLGCERVSITAYNSKTGVSHPVAVVGISVEQELEWQASHPGTSLRDYLTIDEFTCLQKDDILIVDASKTSDRILPYDVQTLLIVLMRVGQEVVGTLALDYGGIAHAYAPDEVALAHMVARLTGFVIERDRLLWERAEAQATELALREANRRMDAFLSLASHELKTPLTIVNGNVQIAERRILRLVEQGVEPAATVVPLLERAHQNVGRLNRLVEDLLDMTRIETDRLHMQFESCNLVALVRDVVQEQRDIDHVGDIQLHLPDSEPGPIIADAARIRQVLHNYLTNAFKYAPPERTITVGVTTEEGNVRVWVRDEGPGLPLADQAHVWERFFRAEGVERHVGSSEGLGLGLYISRTIIDEHGGEVGVESALGNGATFWFKLPTAEQD